MRMLRRRSDERGAAMVEFALILPIFVALVFGIISYGYMLSYRQGLSQAATEGARAAAIVPSGLDVAAKTTRALTALNQSLDAYGVSCAAGNPGILSRGTENSGTCTILPSTACPEDNTRKCATITVTHAYRDHPLIPSFPGLGVTLPQNLTYTAVVEVN